MIVEGEDRRQHVVPKGTLFLPVVQKATCCSDRLFRPVVPKNRPVVLLEQRVKNRNNRSKSQNNRSLCSDRLFRQVVPTGCSEFSTGCSNKKFLIYWNIGSEQMVGTTGRLVDPTCCSTNSTGCSKYKKRFRIRILNLNSESGFRNRILIQNPNSESGF